jgi:hypothetical protein
LNGAGLAMVRGVDRVLGPVEDVAIEPVLRWMHVAEWATGKIHDRLMYCARYTKRILAGFLSYSLTMLGKALAGKMPNVPRPRMRGGRSCFGR